MIEMMNVGRWLDGQASVNISFPERNSATISDSLMLPGRIIEEGNAESSVQE